jgi:hypothetical protein
VPLAGMAQEEVTRQAWEERKTYALVF